MAKRKLGLILWMLSIGSIGFPQSAFQGITPGSSTRDDVASVLGQPVRKVNQTLFEYKPPEGIARIEVEYRTGSTIVERIEVYFVRPVSRAALIKKFDLPQADARKTNAEKKLVEYFGGSSSLAFTYESADVTSGVGQMGYYSRQLLASASGVDVPSNLSQKRDGAVRPMQLENEIYLDGTNLTYYPRSSVDQCKADCENNPNCKGFTWIRAGTYNPGDSAMCYLLSAVTRKVNARGHVSAVKE